MSLHLRLVFRQCCNLIVFGFDLIFECADFSSELADLL